MVTTSLSIPLTIVMALERFGLASSFASPAVKKKLTVHVVGAAPEYELDVAPRTVEEVRDVHPARKSVILIRRGRLFSSRSFISCQASKSSTSSTLDRIWKETSKARGRCRCAPSVAMPSAVAPSPSWGAFSFCSLFFGCLDQLLTFLSCRSLYHDFLCTCPPTPDLIIAFNSGIHSQLPPTSWIPTISAILARKIPTCFTSYSLEEARKDMTTLKAVVESCRLKLDVVWSEETNPWQDCRKTFDLWTEERYFAGNSFTMGFKGV